MSNRPQPEGDARRDAILAFLADFWREYGYGPTFAELAAGVGLAGTSTVAQHIEILREAGCVAMEPGKTRTLRVVDL